MYPFSYTNLKVIHDQKIQAALEQKRLDAERAMQRQGVLQTLKKFLARFNNHLLENKREFLSDCAETSSNGRFVPEGKAL